MRRFDLEHTFRFLNGPWAGPSHTHATNCRGSVDLIIAAYTQLLLASPAAKNYRLPWQKPLASTMLTPARVRSAYSRICQTSWHPASTPKVSRGDLANPKVDKPQKSMGPTRWKTPRR